MARLMAAMSGGVDSSLAAAVLVAQGHEVTGVTLKQWDDPGEVVRTTKGCSVIDAVADARRAADSLGIPHYTLDFRATFSREVIEPFASDYAAGRTPNPCVRCNELVRFGALLDKAVRLGFDGLVTGHHARVARREGAVVLLRGRDAARDQSYVLYALGQHALRRAHMPIGEFTSKHDVREAARAAGLPTADREESVEVCFVPEGATPGDVVASRLPVAVRRGPILDASGEVVGEHRGLAYYTIGQRKGLGAFGARRYVASIDAERNAIVAGTADGLMAAGLQASRPRWVSGSEPADGSTLEAVVRYQGRPARCTFEAGRGGFTVRFAESVRAVAPGQAVVLYDGERVVGGGTIERALRATTGSD